MFNRDEHLNADQWARLAKYLKIAERQYPQYPWFGFCKTAAEVITTLKRHENEKDKKGTAYV